MKRLCILTLCTMASALAGCSLLGTKYRVGGTVTGLNGTGLVIEDNSGSDLLVQGNGGFVFGGRLANNAAYSVTVKTQPSHPAQTCAVRNASGTIDKADVTDVIVSCTQTGRFAYVANRQSNTVSAYAIDPANGALFALSGAPFAATGMISPTALAVDPDGDFLYVANSGSNTVSVFSINSATGTLTPVGSSSSAGTNPNAVAVDPANRFVFVANLTSNSVSIYTTNNGVLTPVHGSPFIVGLQPASLLVDPNGKFLYVAHFDAGKVAVFFIDRATGALSIVTGSPFGAGGGPLSIAIDPSDSFAYVANQAAGSISEYSLSAASGALSALAGSPISAASNVESLVADPHGRYVYAANAAARDNVASYSIAPASGALTLQSQAAAGFLPIHIAVDPSGQFVYAVNYNSNDISGYSVDTGGVFSPVPGSPFAAGSQPHAIAID